MHARDSIDHGLECAADAGGDHRASAGLRFDRHNAEILVAGKEQRFGAPVELAHIVVGCAFDERDLDSSIRC